MKKFFIYLFVSVSAATLFSCSKEASESTTTTTEGEPIEISINASVGESTRATYTEGDDDYAFSWSYGDLLWLYKSTSTEGSAFTTSSTTNSSSATFTGTMNSWSGTTDLYAIYNPSVQNLEDDSPSINTSDGTVTYSFEGNTYLTEVMTSSTTSINNMGLFVGVINDATVTDIPDVALNQAMSFLQIKFEGLTTEISEISLSTSSGESSFVTSAKIDIATGEINEVLATSSTLYYRLNIDETNNIVTIPLLPTNMTSPIILSCYSEEIEYSFSATECDGFFERNSVHTGSINISEFSYVEINYGCDLSDMSPYLTDDNTIQVQSITVDCGYNTELTEDDFEGLRAFLNNQNRKNVKLTLSNLSSDIPASALDGIDAINELVISASNMSSLKIGNYAFKGCSSLETVDLRNLDYYEIGDNSFENCVNLQSVDGNLDCSTSIGDSAFKNCGNLDINLSLNKITYIGDYAFYNCNKIGDIELGKESSDVKLTYLGVGAFSYDSGSYEQKSNVELSYLVAGASSDGSSSYTEDKNLYLYSGNAEYLTGDKTLNVSGQSYTFNTVYLNGMEYVHDSSSSSDDPSSSVSVDNANKVSW